MKQTRYSLLIALFAFVGILSGCKTDPPAVPVADKIKKSYTATSVTENGTAVYSSTGSTSTKPGYSQFLLDLSSPPTVRYRAFDGTLFTGTYTLVGDTQIVLSGLTPVPTGTGGTITFNISDIGDGSTPTLTRTTGDAKSGNTTNVYKLKG